MEKTEDKKQVKRGRPARRRPMSRAKTSSPVTVREGDTFEQIVNGEKLVFEWVNGTPKLIKQISLQKNRERKFRLRPIPLYLKTTCRRYSFNPGEGFRIMRFWQKNVEGSKHDPTKENILTAPNSDIAMILATENKYLEEVFEEIKVEDEETEDTEEETEKTEEAEK